MPAELAFLPTFGFSAEWLAAQRAWADERKTCPVQHLIASGAIDADTYYCGLAAYLGRSFIDNAPRVRWVGNLSTALREGCALIDDGAARRWLLAPQGEMLRRVARRGGNDLPDFAITTPRHLSTLLLRAHPEEVRRIAVHGLATRDPSLCACGVERGASAIALLGLVLAACAATWAAPRALTTTLTSMFFIGLVQRFIACFMPRRDPPTRDVSDADLPAYTILVPLHDEADVVDDLVWSLVRLEYPGAKLDIRLILEPEDAETRNALARHRLPPWMRIVVTPEGEDLRTKPRALNVGLIGAEGELVAVFDAEDRPDPGQLRAAVRRFAADPKLAVLQAPLRIEGEGLLATFFRLEYAALFEVINPGLGRLGWPVALGGSSNHIRRDVLEAVGGWDAWNVTEDADLGLRLARSAFKVGVLLDEATWETPPPTVHVWFQQRRRWMKGWLQTFSVLARDPRRLIREMGPARVAILAAMFVNMILGPLVRPVFFVVVCCRLGVGAGFGDLFLLCVAGSGFFLSAVCGVRGLARLRRYKDILIVPCLPFYELAIGFAAWRAVLDFIRNPQHWYKTPHVPRGP